MDRLERLARLLQRAVELLAQMIVRERLIRRRRREVIQLVKPPEEQRAGD